MHVNGKNGYLKAKPIILMISRKDGKDKIYDGRHRLAAAIESRIEFVYVKFASQ